MLNALGVLSYLPERYALDGLYRYLFEPKTREAWDREVTDALLSFSLDGRDRDERLLRSYLAYHEDVFAHFEPKVQSNVNAQVAQVLSPFNHPDLVDAFCTEAGTQARMEAVLDDDVYLVALPLALYGLGAKTAYTFIKLRFFNLMQRRRFEKAWNQSRPVFFFCDESGNRQLRQGRRVGPQFSGQVAFERLHRRRLGPRRQFVLRRDRRPRPRGHGAPKLPANDLLPHRGSRHDRAHELSARRRRRRPDLRERRQLDDNGPRRFLEQRRLRARAAAPKRYQPAAKRTDGQDRGLRCQGLTTRRRRH